MSISQSAVANKLRLLRLSFEEQRMILENNLTERHGRALLRIDDERIRKETLERIVSDKLNVSGTETLVEELVSGSVTSPKAVPDTEKCGSSTAEKNRERDLENTVRSIRKKVDCWVSDGGNAEINVTNRQGAVELFIKLLM